MSLLEAGGTVISAGKLQEITFLVVVIQTAEETCDGVFVLAAGDFGDYISGSVGTDEVKVVEGRGF